MCYPASGFEARGKDNSLYPLVMPGIPDTPMWTNTFFKEDVTGRDLIRVFWTWYNAESADNNGEIVWEAPANPRWRFGNSRALYKMYFTSEMRDPMETAEQSAALHFAKDFLPIVNKALAEVYHKLNANDSGGSAAEKPAAARTKTLSESSDATKTTPAAEERTDAAASKDQSPSTPAAESPKADQ